MTSSVNIACDITGKVHNHELHVYMHIGCPVPGIFLIILLNGVFSTPSLLVQFFMHSIQLSFSMITLATSLEQREQKHVTTIPVNNSVCSCIPCPNWRLRYCKAKCMQRMGNYLGGAGGMPPPQGKFWKSGLQRLNMSHMLSSCATKIITNVTFNSHHW